MSAIQKRIKFLRDVRETQIALLVITALGGFVVFIAGLIWPSFFRYDYWYFHSTFFTDVLRFWPAFLWGGGVTLFLAMNGGIRSTVYDEFFLGQGINTSLGAGVTEELWFRGVGVFFAMIGLIVTNWLLSVAGWVFMIILVLGIIIVVIVVPIALIRRELSMASFIGALFSLAGAGAFLYALIVFHENPLYRIYNDLFYPIISFLSFGKMDSVLYGDDPWLLIMAFVSANFWFRNGHKYQGFFGYSNSWWLGCVFVYATVTYGLPVAIVVHALYDIVIDITRYLGAKLWG